MITVLPSERRRNFQSMTKLQSSKRNLFSIRDTRHVGPKKYFVVSEVRYTDPITYKIKDFNGEEIKGSFYEQKLQKITQEMFRIEKVIRRKGDKSISQYSTVVLTVVRVMIAMYRK